MIYRLIILSVSSIAFALLVWIAFPTSKRNILLQESAYKKASLPDAWMESAEATFMNQEGRVLMKIRTPKMTHFVENDTTFLETPEFLLYRNAPEPWHIQAGKAIATKGMENIRLSETVTLHYPGDATQVATWVNTDKVIIHPEQKTAETKESVTLTQPNITVRGKGLKANLDTGDIKLLSETRGEYAFNQ